MDGIDVTEMLFLVEFPEAGTVFGFSDELGEEECPS
jgi:hypothetical protein